MEEIKMNISARNQLKGKVSVISKGAVSGIVTVDIGVGKVSATISMEAIESLGMEVGKEATAIVKATEVLIALETSTISARNQLEGSVISIEKGVVNSVVKLDIGNGITVTSIISNAAVLDLGLEVGSKAAAIVKATTVMIGCE
jgi:molybdate transport system regulatory protein